MWVDQHRSPHGDPELAKPPKSGKGASQQAWLEYATTAGYQVDPGTQRSDIIAMVESGPPQGRQRRALEQQVEAMATGREHRALVEACRAIADRIDELEARGGFPDKAWREYRLALKELREAVTDDGSSSDSIEEWITASRGEVRDTENAGT